MEASHHTGTSGQQVLSKEDFAARQPGEKQLQQSDPPLKIMKQVDSSDYEDDEDGQYEEVAFDEFDEDDDGDNAKAQPAAVAKP